MNRPEIDSTSIRAEPDGLALTLWVGHGPTSFTFRADLAALETLQAQIRDALAGKYDFRPFPACRTCHGQLALARDKTPDREFWVHAVSDMDSHPPDPVWTAIEAVEAP